MAQVWAWAQAGGRFQQRDRLKDAPIQRKNAALDVRRAAFAFDDTTWRGLRRASGSRVPDGRHPGRRFTMPARRFAAPPAVFQAPESAPARDNGQRKRRTFAGAQSQTTTTGEADRPQTAAGLSDRETTRDKLARTRLGSSWPMGANLENPILLRTPCVHTPYARRSLRDSRCWNSHPHTHGPHNAYTGLGKDPA